MRRLSACLCVLAALCLSGCSSESTNQTEKCDLESTYDVVNEVFATRGCTASTCHGADAASAAAGLDLRSDTLYENTVNVVAASSALPLVFPADEERSVLFLKVAAKTAGTSLTDFGVAGGPMPTTGDALSEDELQLVRAWIRGGAPRTGVVSDAPDVLGCGTEIEPSPNKIPPLPEPDADKGIQLASGGWALSAETENEVCYVTYYDVSDRVPDDAKIPCPDAYGGPDRECFAYASMLLAQDPQSHHSIVESYIPPPEKPEQWDPNSADWKNWQCLDGPNDGEPCDPKDAGFCGEGSRCATAPLTAIGCTVYANAPQELGTIAGFFGQASTRQNVAVAQEATFVEDYPDGVYGVIPTVGFTIWNSHSFNLTKEDTTVSQYVNFTYARPEQRRFQRQDLTVLDDIFAMGTIPPFESSESCATFTLPVGSRLLTLSSHTHQFGRDFRIWYPPNQSCRAGPECEAPNREPDYRSFTYQDPLYQRFDAEKNLTILDSEDEDDRTFRYCAVWDNGATDPAEVRKHSNRPAANSCAFGDITPFIGPCGCPEEDRACVGGAYEGRSCGGDDSVCGEGGVCDACPVWGGVTTEEEMFGILGAYYVAQETP